MPVGPELSAHGSAGLRMKAWAARSNGSGDRQTPPAVRTRRASRRERGGHVPGGGLPEDLRSRASMSHHTEHYCSRGILKLLLRSGRDKLEVISQDSQAEFRW